MPADCQSMEEIGCSNVDVYCHRLVHDPKEWRVLDGLCRVTISRFYRDRHVFDALSFLNGGEDPGAREGS